MTLPGRQANPGNYRYGFNGMEKDGEEWSGNAANQLDFGARIYDSRIGKWLSIDKKWKIYPSFSSYIFALGNPIMFIDPDGNTVVPGENLPEEHRKKIYAKIELAKGSGIFIKIWERVHEVSDNEYTVYSTEDPGFAQGFFVGNWVAPSIEEVLNFETGEVTEEVVYEGDGDYFGTISYSMKYDELEMGEEGNPEEMEAVFQSNIIEELVHVMQYDKVTAELGNASINKPATLNSEFEAKVITGMVLFEAGLIDPSNAQTYFAVLNSSAVEYGYRIASGSASLENYDIEMQNWISSKEGQAYINDMKARQDDSEPVIINELVN